MCVTKFKKMAWSLTVCVMAFAATSQALPIISSVEQTGGDNDPADTGPAKATGMVVTNNVATEFLTPYTVPLFGEDVYCYTDRAHQWNGISAVMPLPNYLVGGEYVMIGNDNRDNAGLQVTVTFSEAVIVYLLVDNRLGDAAAGTPPHNGAEIIDWPTMTWVAAFTNGFAPVLNGLNRTSDPNIPDEVAIDGDGNGVGPGVSLADYSSVYAAVFEPGTYNFLQADNASQNMYGIVVKRAPGSITAPPEVVTLSPTNNTMSADAAAGISFHVTTVAPNSVAAADIKLFLNGVAATPLNITGTSTDRVVTFSGIAANNYYRAQIVATDQAGRSSTNDFAFDTFGAGAITIEAEDYNFEGGQVRSPLAPNAYVDAVGTPGIDYLDQNGSALPTVYRLQDFVGLATAVDLPRQAFVDVGATDFMVNALEAGDWMNYTRTIPAGNYRIFLRGNATATTRAELAKVSGATTASQTSTPIGVFDLRSGPNTYAPLTDVGGRPVVVTLGGETTLRLTALSALYNMNINYIILVPTSDPVSPAYIASIGPVGANQSPATVIRAAALNGSTAAAAVVLLVDGVDVSSQATVVPNASGFSGSYDPTGDLTAGSAHTVSLILQDSAGSRTTNDWAFTVSAGPTLPTNIKTATGTGVGSGFNVRMHKIRNDATGLANTLARAESQLANQLIDPITLEPYFNEAGGLNGDGLSTNLVINFQQGSSATDTALPSGYFGADELFPHVTPSTYGDPNFMAMEATAYLELAPGMYRFGVRSDDGFKLSFGPDFKAANGAIIGSLDATRGDGLPGGANELNVFITEAGLYPVRLVWFEGTGGAALEFYSVDPITLKRTLINDPNSPNAIKAFFNRTVQIFTPTITLTSPVGPVYENFPTNIALTVNAAVQGGTIARVEYFNGTNKIAEATTAPFSAVLAATEPGRYSISAKATDTVGFSAISGTTNFIVGKLIGINFQAITALTPEGFLADTGVIFADQGNGFSYGWNDDNTAHARDRNSVNSPNELYDTFNHMQKTDPLPAGSSWEIELPNGRYKVFGASGDPDNVDSTFNILLEDQPFIAGVPTTAQRFVSGTNTVTVADGRLTLSNGPGAANNKINFLEIYAMPAGSEAPTLVLTRTAGGVQINWTGGGMLQSKTDLNSPGWTDINTSGSYTESSTAGNKFFRVIQ